MIWQKGAKLKKWYWLVPEAEGGWKMVPRVVTRKQVGGWLDAGERGIPRSVALTFS